MGSASSTIGSKISDASDITDLAEAKKEIVESRALIKEYALQDWKEVALKAKADKTGWAIWNGKVLLCGASKQYDQPITVEVGDPIPFNETKGLWEEGGADHWFEIPLNDPNIRNDIGMKIPGRLFTTRMPRGIDLAAGDEWPKNVKEKHIKQGRTERSYFEENVKDFGVNHAFVLVEEFEMESVASKGLLDFYKGLGITVHHTPIVDFTAPSFEIEKDNISDLNTALMQGGNCIIHCMGGTGRTGTVLTGAVQNLGVDNAVKFCRKIKSTYLEIKEQEEFLESHSKVITQQMMDKCPNFTYKIILDQIEELCKENNDGKLSVLDSADATGAEEEAVLKQCFNLIDQHGSDGFVSVSEFTSFLAKRISAENGLDADAYTNITNGKMKAVFQIIDPSVADVDFDIDSIKFEVFLSMMNKKPEWSAAAKKGETAASKGHG